MKSTGITLALALLVSATAQASEEPQRTQEIRLIYPIPVTSKEAGIAIYHRRTQTMYLVRACEKTGSEAEKSYLLPATVEGEVLISGWAEYAKGSALPVTLPLKDPAPIVLPKSTAYLRVQIPGAVYDTIAGGGAEDIYLSVFRITAEGIDPGFLAREQVSPVRPAKERGYQEALVRMDGVTPGRYVMTVAYGGFLKTLYTRNFEITAEEAHTFESLLPLMDTSDFPAHHIELTAADEWAGIAAPVSLLQPRRFVAIDGQGKVIEEW